MALKALGVKMLQAVSPDLYHRHRPNKRLLQKKKANIMQLTSEKQFIVPARALQMYFFFFKQSNMHIFH